SRAAVWIDLSRSAVAGSCVSASVRQPAVHQRGRKLGTANSRDLHHRSRWTDPVLCGERRLHRAARTNRDRACTQGLKPSSLDALTERLKPCPSTNPFRKRAHTLLSIQ